MNGIVCIRFRGYNKIVDKGSGQVKEEELRQDNRVVEQIVDDMDFLMMI